MTAQVSSRQSPAMAADQKVTFHLFEVAKTPDFRGEHGDPTKSGKIGMTEMKPYTKKRLSEATSSTKSLGGEIVKKETRCKKKDVAGWVHTRIGALSRTSLCNITSI